jgi:peptide/nickel transport system substrate-binding protein
MRSTKLRVLTPGLIVLAAVALGACGSSSSSSSNVAATQSKFAPPTAPPSSAQKGGTLTVLVSGDVDYIDPGAAYYQFTYMVDSATDRALLSWPPDDLTTPKPDLATGEPTVSSDGKTVTFHIRTGIKYSPPLGGGAGWNKPVTSADVKYAIERTLIPGVPNGYQNLYFNDIVGYPQAIAAAKKDPTKAPNLSGITTPDDSTVVFKLTQPSSLGLIQALSLPASAPVPQGYAAQFDAQNPSTYGTHQLSTGPYYISSYKPGTEITLDRNPNWDPSTDTRPAYLDKIVFQEGFADTASAGKKILTGSAMVNGDFSPEPETLKLAATQYPNQLTLTPSGGNRYVALNTTKPPFDDINVRKAVIAASDREALRATRGGPLIGDVATHFIPPGMPGFDEAGGVKGPQGPAFDFVQHTTGDMAVAQKYMKKAGFSSGKCEGAHCSITMVGDNSAPGSNTAQVVKAQLTQLGFNVNFHPVDHDVQYTKFCSVPANEPNVCPNVGWIKDFNDGQGMIDIPFNGSSINPENNSNWPQLNDPAVNKALDQAKLITDPTQRAQAYGKIDDMITADAPAIPWVWDNQGNISSKDVAVVINQFNANTDVSYTSLTK